MLFRIPPIFQKISQKIEDIALTGFQSRSGYLRNLRGRLLSSEKFLEAFALWVCTLKPCPDNGSIFLLTVRSF